MRERKSEQREEIKILEIFPSISQSSNAHFKWSYLTWRRLLVSPNGYNTISRDEIWDLNSMSESRSLNEIVELRISPMVSSRQLSDQSTLEWRKKSIFDAGNWFCPFFSPCILFSIFTRLSWKIDNLFWYIFSHLPTPIFLFFQCDTINSSSGFRFDKKFIYRLHRSHMGHGRLSGRRRRLEVESRVKSSKFCYGLELNKDFFSLLSFLVYSSQSWDHRSSPPTLSRSSIILPRVYGKDEVYSTRQTSLTHKTTENFITRKNTQHIPPLDKEKLALFFVISDFQPFSPPQPSQRSIERVFFMCVSSAAPNWS